MTMNESIYHIATTLGLSKHDVDAILSQHHTPTQTTTTLGPPGYAGAHYGTYSIHDYPQ